MNRPTEEQQRAIERFGTRRSLKITAFAGAGKTSTLVHLANTRKSRGMYLAFNKAIAAEAKERFPSTVDCRTTHSIAFREVMPRIGSSPKMTRSVSARQLAASAELRDRSFSSQLNLKSVHQAHLLLGTVRRFCQGADAAIGTAHVPRYGRLLGLPDAVLAEVKAWTAENASQLWGRMTNPSDDLPLGHDGYLKLWALGRPRLAAEYILLDEAQDTNGVVLGVLAEQQAQIVYVGDRHQQIYEWRGAVNAMERIRDCEEASLTLSFRFGDAIASAASKVLASLGETQAIRGNAALDSIIRADGTAGTLLARTNAGVIQEVLEAGAAGRRACVVGGTGELSRLLSDVYDLKKGKPASSPEFFGFQSWREVVAFAETEEGESLRTFVQLVEDKGEGRLWAAVKGCVEEEGDADVIVSTAHKAKGREWDALRLAPDFVGSRGSAEEADAETRLFYVAMTRARRLLVCAPETLALFSSHEARARAAEEAKAGRQAQKRRVEPAAVRQPVAAQVRRPPAPTPRPAAARPTGQGDPTGGARATPPSPATRSEPPRGLLGRIVKAIFG